MTSAKILIIEDQAAMRRNVALMLEMEGYTVFTAADGKAGVDVARQQKPDLILCDVMMPNMDGHEVVKVLRADDAFASTPFIFLTAKGDRADIREGMNYGADDYLIKPVVRADLLGAIETRLIRAEAIQAKIEQAGAGFHPDFDNPAPLQTAFGLTPREAEVLCWVAQGKSNGDVAMILNMSEKTVKQHLGVCFQKMGVESRTAASLAAVEVLAGRKS